MKLTLSLLFFTALLFAQTTKVTITQVTTLPQVTVPTVLVCIPVGGCVAAILDPSLTLDTSVNPPVLKAVVATMQTWIRNESVAIGATPPATVTLANPLIVGTQAVYRNGMRQTPTLDYTLAGNVFTFVLPLQAGENLVFEYRTS